MAKRVRPGLKYSHFHLPLLIEAENVSGERSQANFTIFPRFRPPRALWYS